MCRQKLQAPLSRRRKVSNELLHALPSLLDLLLERLLHPRHLRPDRLLHLPALPAQTGLDPAPVLLDGAVRLRPLPANEARELPTALAKLARDPVAALT